MVPPVLLGSYFSLLELAFSLVMASYNFQNPTITMKNSYSFKDRCRKGKVIRRKISKLVLLKDLNVHKCLQQLCV